MAAPPPESDYPGADFLLRIEESLTHYNDWIVDSFLAGLERGLPADAKVLDFGCGIGTLSRVLFGKTGIRPDGVERDGAQRAICRGRGFRCFESLREAEPAYDLIVASNVLEHVQDDTAVLETIRSHLAVDGSLVVYVPAFDFLWTSLDDKVGHVRRYTREGLRSKLEGAGFRPGKMRYCDSVGFGLALLFKVVGGRDGVPSSRSLRLFDRYLVPLSRLSDVALSRLFGKNILAHAVRDAAASEGRRRLQ